MFYVDRDIDVISDVIRNQRMKMICINDVESIPDIRQMREQLVQAFECHLEKKSAFEK